MRYLFEISYLGTRYNGWQSQLNATGIQSIVEKGLSTILRTDTPIVASGRTDTGVHCRQQFFHADVQEPIEEARLLQQMNSILPEDIAIHSIRPIRPDASARYDAIERTYEYHLNRTKDPLLVGRSFHYFKPIDVPTMNRAAALLLGSQDFECFSKVKTDVNHFICEIKQAEWNENGSRLVFTIRANRFLRGMVRAIVGTLLDVGSGKITEQEFEKIIKSKDRRKAGMNVPPEGLYLMKVVYAEGVFLS